MLSKDSDNHVKVIFLDGNEEGHRSLYFSMSEVPASQGIASTSIQVVVAFAYSRMDLGSNFYGFYNMISYDSEEE